MSGAAPQPVTALTSSEEHTWIWLAHLSGLLGFLGPLIVFLIYRDKSAAVRREAKEALNFQLTVAIATTILFMLGGILAFILVGFVIVLVASFLPLVGVIFAIVGAVTANKTGTYRYPLTARLVK